MQWLIGLLNAHVTAYVVLCYASLVCAVGFAARAVKQAWRDLGASLDSSDKTQTQPNVRWLDDRGCQFLLALGVAVVLFRLPATLTNSVLNQDECLQIISGWSYLHDPVPWRGSDNGTSGPFNSYILTVAFALGLPKKLITARIVMMGLSLFLIGCTYWALRRLGGLLAAIPGALSIALFVCFAWDAGHLHYNSETLSTVLLAAALCLYLVGRSATTTSRNLAFLYATGLLLGTILYAKLQAAPLGLYWAVVFGLDLFLTRNAACSTWRTALAFCLGGITVPAIITLVVAVTGTWHDFVTSYFGFSSGYGMDASTRVVGAFWSFIGPDMPSFLLYSFLLVLIPFICLDKTSKAITPRFRQILFAFLGYLGVALYVVQAPKMGFSHYAALALHPVGLLAGLCTGEIARQLAARATTGRQGAPRMALRWALVLTAAFVVAHILTLRIEMLPEDDPFPTVCHGPGLHWISLLPIPHPNASPTADFIREHARPGDRMSVWGWGADYYIDAGVADATREATTIADMEATFFTGRVQDSLRTYYRQRYLGDLKRSRPRFFVDAVSSVEFFCTDREKFGHETFPELNEFVTENYEKVYEQQIGPGDGTRVYQLKEGKGK